MADTRTAEDPAPGAGRPRITCHMVTSLDGRLLPSRWPVDGAAMTALYEDVAGRLGAEGWIVGRRTMAEFVPCDAPRTGPAPACAPADRIAPHRAPGLAIGIDRTGRLRPQTGRVGDDHLVLVMGEAVAADHVEDLARRGVSVVFAGPTGDDLAGALRRIGQAFGVAHLLLEGGGRINGAFLDAGLVDETSTLIQPVIDGGAEVPAIYRGAAAAVRLKPVATEALADGVVWLRHRVVRAGT